MKETLSVLGKLLKSSGVRKIPLLVQEHKHAGKFLMNWDFYLLKIGLFFLFANIFDHLNFAYEP